MPISCVRLPNSRIYTITDQDYPGVLQVGLGTLPPPPPIALGAWLGWSGTTTPAWNHNQAQVYQDLVGHSPRIIMWYQDLVHSATWDIDRNVSLLPAGVLPLITLELHDTRDLMLAEWSNAAVLSGMHDAAITSFALGCAAYGQPVLIRILHEGTGIWRAWGAGPGNPMGNTPESYIATWRRVVRLFRAAGASNARFIYCPQVHTPGATPNLASVSDCYPGPEYVDYLGLDGYCWGNSGGSNGPWKSFYDVFAFDYAAMTALGPQDLLICETGCVEGDGGNKASWLRAMAAQAQGAFPRLRAIVMFSRLSEGRFDWRIDSTPESLAAYKEVAGQPALSGALRW